MDPFTKLPPELLAKILVYTADFSAVESIISASSRVNTVFRAQPTIVRDLISFDPITSLPEIQIMCHNISLIRTLSAQFPSLADYQQRCENNPPIKYTEELASFILHLVARTQRLACACLTLIQQNFVSALNEIDAGDISASNRVQIACEPFSFTEEYRVYSSLWHLQHYSSLREAATERWHWDEISISGLDKYNKWNRTDVQRAEKMWTTAALLSDLGLSPIYGHYPFQHQQIYLAQDPEGEESSRAAWTFLNATPLPFFQSFDLPPGQDMTRSSPIWTPPSPPPETEATKAWSLGAESRQRLPTHLGIFKIASSMASIQRLPSSYSFVDFKQWRRLGVVVWDAWRMYRIGLFEGLPRSPGEVIPTPEGGYLTVLPRDPDERAQIPSVNYKSRWLALIG
ncbi:hypothetical protein EYZ11_009955 [Aspergillus tanneri]|uniref:Uncharacterized protein n=1 Tax=Aspergillus tanneri TaxID=1220188 RepID=A0A4S3J6J4_9EURO|nr:uncharacterized protein ATNIH1004_005473 [Aspergillus tanneri]KAA8646798.1 hypothetical protein ATNIH1004_005473 [Aspergillus tanneri]THC90576.1 hypothetical protein EYZ11_009955 [Aspergillus tanneri]